MMVTVFAAASLTDAMTELADEFMMDNPGYDIELNFGGSATLREQLLAGAPADVFAPADEATMEEVESLIAGHPVVVATNHLELAVPAGNRHGVTTLADLARDDLVVGLCARGVPCGDLAAMLLDHSGVVAAPDTEEPNVRSLLLKIENAEVDVGLVYRSDVIGSNGSVQSIDLHEGIDLQNRYPIATMDDAANLSAATAFVEFVASDAGANVLETYGFGRP